MDKTTVQYRDQTVDCYGTWEWDSNCLIVGYMPDGAELEEFFTGGAVDWQDAVRRIVDAPIMQGCEIVELTVC